ncbi:tyrosine-type recombinase/integrase [Nitrospira sp. Nam74]
MAEAEEHVSSDDRGDGKQRRTCHYVDENLFWYLDRQGQKKFMVRLMLNGKLWRKFGFPTISKARQWRDSRKGAAADGRLFPEHEQAQQRTMLFRTFAKNWLDSRRTKQLKRSTLRRYEGLLAQHLLPAFGQLPLASIDRTKVRALANHAHSLGLKPKTIHNIVRALSSVFSQAIEEGLVLQNPAHKPSALIQLPKKGEHVEVFTHEEEVHLLEIAKHACPREYPFILALFRTGARFGEAVALMPEDINFRDRYVVIQRNFTMGYLEDSPKSGRRREVDLSQDLLLILKEHVALQEAEAALLGQPRPKWLFASPAGSIIRWNNFRDRVWKPLLRKAGLDYRWIHATRHTFATRLIVEDANIVYVQKQLGHSSIQITVDLYTHWIRRAERKSSLEVDRLLAPPIASRAS